MNPALRVVTPGLLTTVQDLGRTGFQHLGIPVSGALDTMSLRAANFLVGNAPEMAALEIAYVGPTLVVEAEEVRIGIAGAQATIEILPDVSAVTGRTVDPMRSIRIRRGEVIRIGSLTNGAVLYLAVEGGFDIAPVLGSAATYIRGGVGGWQGRPLLNGDLVPLSLDTPSAREDMEYSDLVLPQQKVFRTLPAPQSDHFSESEREAFFSNEYTVSLGSDRMGMRLSGRKIRHQRGFDIVSDGIAPGSIQIPGNGQPIVLLADRQTTGGYPKIATVISADLPALGRCGIGAKIRFKPVTMPEAEQARRELFAEIDALPEKLTPVANSHTNIEARLYQHNLISGVIDAAT